MEDIEPLRARVAELWDMHQQLAARHGSVVGMPRHAAARTGRPRTAAAARSQQLRRAEHAADSGRYARRPAGLRACGARPGVGGNSAGVRTPGSTQGERLMYGVLPPNARRIFASMHATMASSRARSRIRRSQRGTGFARRAALMAAPRQWASPRMSIEWGCYPPFPATRRTHGTAEHRASEEIPDTRESVRSDCLHDAHRRSGCRSRYAFLSLPCSSASGSRSTISSASDGRSILCRASISAGRWLRDIRTPPPAGSNISTSHGRRETANIIGGCRLTRHLALGRCDKRPQAGNDQPDHSPGRDTPTASRPACRRNQHCARGFPATHLRATQ